MKAPGTPTITIFPVVGIDTEFSGFVSQTDLGAAGREEPTAIVMMIVGGGQGR